MILCQPWVDGVQWRVGILEHSMTAVVVRADTKLQSAGTDLELAYIEGAPWPIAVPVQ